VRLVQPASCGLFAIWRRDGIGIVTPTGRMMVVRSPAVAARISRFTGSKPLKPFIGKALAGGPVSPVGHGDFCQHPARAPANWALSVRTVLRTSSTYKQKGFQDPFFRGYQSGYLFVRRIKCGATARIYPRGNSFEKTQRTNPRTRRPARLSAD